MAARSIGSLTVSFGLVAIPVKLYSATQSSGSISFNLLHKGCGSRLKQQYICSKHESVLERDDIVKGYEFAKDQYVVFEPEEIKALEEVGSRAVEISEFVPIASIDPVYFDKTYYLAPDRGADKPYALLVEALTAGLTGHGRADPREGWGATVFVQVMNPACYGGAAAFLRQTEHVAATCRATPPRPGFERVRLPGESGLRRRAEQLQNGVQLHPSILPALEPWTERLGVSIADFGLRIAD